LKIGTFCYYEFKDSPVEYFKFKRTAVNSLIIILTDSSQEPFGSVEVPISKIQRFTTTTNWYDVNLFSKTIWKSARMNITLISE
jgi:hypothetical protein